MVSSLFNQSQTLSEPHRQKLDKIVSTLMDEGADDQSIQAVVNDYKKKYVGVRTKPKPMPGELTGGLDSLPVGLSAKESAAESLKMGRQNYFENEAAKRKAKTLDATQTAKVLNDAAASIAGAFTDNPVTDALAKGKKLMAQTLGQGPANLAFGPGEKGLAGHVGGLIGGTVAAPFDIGADVVNFAGKGEWQAGVNILLKSGALFIPAAKGVKLGYEAFQGTKAGMRFNAARGMKALIESGMDPVKAKQFVAKVTEDVKKPPVTSSEIPNTSTPPGLAETVGAKRTPKAEPAAKPLEDGQTPFKTKVEDIVLSDRDTPYNLVDVAKSGGFSWEGVAPKHAKRLRALGVTADDLTQVVADRMESLAVASSRQNLDSGVLRLKTGTKLSDGELKAILQDIRGNRQRLRDMGYNTAGYLPTKEETVARTAPQVPKAEPTVEPKKTPLKTVVLSDKEGKQFPAHASDFTDEDLLNQLDKKRQAARDIATHQPTNANGKATMHDVRELQAEVDRRGLGKDTGEPTKTEATGDKTTPVETGKVTIQEALDDYLRRTGSDPEFFDTEHPTVVKHHNALNTYLAQGVDAPTVAMPSMIDAMNKGNLARRGISLPELQPGYEWEISNIGGDGSGNSSITLRLHSERFSRSFVGAGPDHASAVESALGKARESSPEVFTPPVSEVPSAPKTPETGNETPYTRYIEPERDLKRIILGSEHPADINKVIDWVRSMRDVPPESGGNTRMIVLNALKARPGAGAERGSEPLFEALINAVDKGKITPQNGIDLLEAANPNDFGFGADISQAASDFRKRYDLPDGSPATRTFDGSTVGDRAGLRNQEVLPAVDQRQGATSGNGANRPRGEVPDLSSQRTMGGQKSASPANVDVPDGGANPRVSGLTPKTKADKKLYEALSSDPDARVVIYKGKVKGGGYHEFVDVTWYNKEKGRTNKPAGIPDAYASAKTSELSPEFREQLRELNQTPETGTQGPLGSTTGRVLYREAHPNEFMSNDLMNPGKFFSDNPDLAIGQGENKGVIYEVRFKDSAKINEHAKPGTGLNGKEFVIGANQATGTGRAMGAIEALTVKPGVKLPKDMQLNLDRFWTKTENADGSVRYTPKKTTPKTPEVETPAEPRTVAHADTESVLKDWGESLRESNPETINQWVENAANSKRAPRDVAKEVLADPRPMTKEEQIQLGIRMNQIDEEVKAGVKDNIEEGVEIVRALDAAGSEWGRSGLSRQILLRTNYSEVALKARAEKVAPKGLNAKQVGLIEAQAKRIAELEAQVASKTPRPVRTREVIQAERSKIIDEIKAIRQEAMSKVSDAPQFVGHVAQMIPKAVKVGVLYLEEGAVAAGELLGKLRADFGDTFTEEQYAQINRDAIGEHGRNLNAGRKAYGEDIQVKGTAGIQDKEVKILRAKLDLAKRDADALIERLRPKTTGEKLITVANIPRSLQASVDVSAPGRQGWYGLFVDPKGWAKGWSAQAKAMVSPERAMQELNVIKDHPEYHTAVQSGLHMNEIDAPLTAGEEAMFGNVVGRTHPKLKGKSIPNPFAGSERAYNAFLNRQRLDMFTNLKKKLGESASDADLKGLANFVNVVTGRGGASIPGFKQAAGFLSTGFYSPKFLASRIELAIGAPILKSGLSKQARVLLAKQHLKITAAQLTSLSLLVYGAKKAFGDENVTLNNDPSSSDYGKLQIKDGERTVFMDTGAGVLAPMVAAFRFGTGKTTSASGNVKKLDEDYGASREALVGRFIRSKLNPTVGAAWSLISGKNYIGEKYGAKEAAKELLLPMSPREITEELMTDGMSKADVLTLFNLVGISVNTYKKPSPK